MKEGKIRVAHKWKAKVWTLLFLFPRVIIYYSHHLPSNTFPFGFCFHSLSWRKLSEPGEGKISSLFPFIQSYFLIIPTWLFNWPKYLKACSLYKGPYTWFSHLKEGEFHTLYWLFSNSTPYLCVKASLSPNALLVQTPQFT